MYQIQLDNFEGPIDLLLYFIRRDELDIYDIPISKITKEFVDTVEEWEKMHLHVAGDFIVMASTLMRIKARLLLPRQELDDEGEIIDPRTLVPLDEKTILNSAKKTGRVVVVDEGHQNFGVTAEIASRISEKAFYYLDAPVIRMGAMDVPVPFSPVLEDLTVPTAEKVASNARKIVAGELVHEL